MRVDCAPSRDCAPSQPHVFSSRSVSALALLSFAMLIVSLDQYIVVVALPEIARDLGYSAQTLQTGIGFLLCSWPTQIP